MRFLILLSLLLLSPLCQAATIIFDFEGVIIEKNDHLSIMWDIGPLNFLGGYNPLALSDHFFDLLHSINPIHPLPSFSHNGKKMPHIMVEWLAGHHSCHSMRTQIKNKLKQRKKDFNAFGHKRALTAIIDYTFTPTRLAKSFKVMSKTFKLIQGLAKNNHTLCLLTNFDKETFAHVRKDPKINKILNHFHYIIVSGEVQLVKPDPAIFHYCFNQCNIDPDLDLTVYLDDTLEHINSAKTLNKKNLHCFHFTNKQFSALLKKLQKLNIAYL